jgi:hypothetical protein
VAAHVAEALGEEVSFVRAGSLSIRVARAMACLDRAPGLAAGTEGAELAALGARGLAERPVELLSAAGSVGLSPIDYLEREGTLDALAAASARADVLGVPLVKGGRVAAGAEGILPPGFASENGIDVVEAAAGALVLAAPRPSAALSRRAAHLMSGWSIAWRVLPRRNRLSGVQV